MSLNIPDPLPVGISRSEQFNNRYQRERNLTEDRHHAFSAHIGIAGKSYAKHFPIDRFGEEQAFQLAAAWRNVMEESAGKLSKWQGKVGVPGKRRPKLTRSSPKKKASLTEKTSPERLREVINGLFPSNNLGTGKFRYTGESFPADRIMGAATATQDRQRLPLQ